MGLIGREDEQRSIATLISDARGARSGVLAVVGDPGVGKSALLNHAVELADGMNVLRAHGVQSEAQIPFAGLSELLRPALRHLDRLPEAQAAALQGALALIPARSEDRFAVGAAALSLLAAYAEDLPVLVVLDDAHWLDGSSAGALSFAFRRLLADPVAVLLGVRGGEPSLLDGSDLPCMHLDGLDFDAAATLIANTAGPVTDELAQRLHRHTGGNPLALIEAAREIEHFRDEGPIELPLPIATRVSEVYASRWRALSDPCRQILLLAAASDTGDLPTIARAATATSHLDTLEEAENHKLVELHPGHIEFVHPLARSAIYADASPQERRHAHRALAAALPDTDVDRRAWHLAQAAIGPDDAACSALEQSAIRSRDRNAYDVASRTFERAAQLAPEEPRRARLLLQAAESAWASGDGLRTKDLLQRAEAHSDGPELSSDIEHLRGRVATRLGPVSDAIPILLTGAKLASPEHAILMLADAVNAAFFAADPDSMRAAAEELTRVDTSGLSDRTQFFALMAHGMALTFAWGSDNGAALLRSAIAIALRDARSMDDPVWLTWAAMGVLWLRESSTDRALIQQATDVARSRTSLGVLPFLLGHIAIEDATSNRWAEAEATFHEAIHLAEETGQQTLHSFALSRLAWLEGRQGKKELCLRHAAEAIRLADELDIKLSKLWALAALGDLFLATGRTEEATQHLQQHLDLLHGITDVDQSPAPELVELHLRQGDVTAASSFAAEYQQRAETKGQPWALARAARCRGLLAADDHIDEPFTEALAIHKKTPDIFETARTHLAYGSRLRRARQRVRAREQLEAAIDIFDDLGAVPWGSMSRSELAATGVTARKRDESTRNQLTPQELQIALLLADNHTTKQTAAALFLSPKTVEYHLRNVYRKLGCNTREELAKKLLP